jgi:hypothetical protein
MSWAGEGFVLACLIFGAGVFAGWIGVLGLLLLLCILLTVRVL